MLVIDRRRRSTRATLHVPAGRLSRKQSARGETAWIQYVRRVYSNVYEVICCYTLHDQVQPSSPLEVDHAHLTDANALSCRRHGRY